MADREDLGNRVDKLAEQRRAKRSSQLEEFVVHTPEQASTTPRFRGRSPTMRTQGVGVQAVVELREMEVQTSVSLPDTVAALWHCQVPRTIIDMSPQEVESRVEDEHDQDGDHLDSTDVGDDEEVVPCRETDQFQDNIFLPVDVGMSQNPHHSDACLNMLLWLQPRCLQPVELLLHLTVTELMRHGRRPPTRLTMAG